MKKLIIITLILLNFEGYSQDYDQMMVKKQVECSDIAYNCGLYFMKYVQENKPDSLNSLLDPVHYRRVGKLRPEWKFEGIEVRDEEMIVDGRWSIFDFRWFRNL